MNYWGVITLLMSYSNIWCTQTEIPRKTEEKFDSEKKKKGEKTGRESGQKKQPVSGHPEKEQQGSIGLFTFCSLSHSQSLDPDIIPVAVQLIPTLNPPMLLSRAGREIYQTIKKHSTTNPAPNKYMETSEAHKYSSPQHSPLMFTISHIAEIKINSPYTAPTPFWCHKRASHREEIPLNLPNEMVTVGRTLIINAIPIHKSS